MTSLKKLIFLTEYIFFIILKQITLLLGFKYSIILGRILGRLAFKVVKNLRDASLKNANVIYGSNDKNVIKTLKKAFENIGIFIVHSFFVNKINENNYHKFVEFEGYKHIEEGLNYGNGVIVVTGHFGNWEFLAGVPSRLGWVKLAVVMNRQINPYTERMIVETRKKANIETIYNQPEEVKKIITFLKSGWIVGMVVDQAYYFDPIYVKFFGKEAPTARGPAVFHLKLKSPIVMARSIFMKDGKYILKFYPPLFFDLPYNNESIKQIMGYINQKFEEWIKEDPTQWFSWTHPRWDVEGIVIRKKEKY
ncbi:MAG: lysophospholipid acyltransferase family protein [Brevinematales bacterium]|nr:lysophospholipid acyltransferase family protein [Brevinematales bacterium]